MVRRRGLLGAVALASFGACTCAQLPKDVVFCGPDGGDCAGDAGVNSDAGPRAADGGSDAGRLPDGGVVDAGLDAGLCPPPVLAQECVATGWCWDNPLPHGNTLLGVWAFAGDDVWAVSQFGMISHLGPAGVVAVNSPATADLNAIWGSEPNDLWMVGNGGTTVHWNCGFAAGDAGSGALRSVWGSGPADVWAVGDQGAFHWDGGSWSGPLAGSLAPLTGVWGDAPGDFWAVTSSGNVLRWDGSLWTNLTAVNASGLDAVWGRGGRLFAGGAGGAWYSDVITDGGSWVQTLACPSVVHAIWGNDAGEVFLGADGALYASSGGVVPGACGGGGSWTVIGGSVPAITSGSASGSGSWIGGVGGWLAVIDGGGWTTLSGGHSGSLYGVFAEATQVLAGGSDDLGEGQFLDRTPGGVWTSQHPDAGRIVSISGVVANDVWAIDSTGSVWNHTAAGWQSPFSGPPATLIPAAIVENLYDGGQEIWVDGFPSVGPNAYVRVNGAWVAKSYNSTYPLHALWTTPTNRNVWVAGPQGSFARTDVTTLPPFTQIVSTGTAVLNGIWSDGTTIWAVGDNICAGPLLGQTLCVADPFQPTGTSVLNAVAGRSTAVGDELWAVGTGGYALSGDGTMWKPLPVGSVNTLHAVTWGGPDAGFWAVGDFETILHKP